MARKKGDKSGSISFEEVEKLLLTENEKKLLEMIQVVEKTPTDPETTTRIIEQIQDNRFRRYVTVALLVLLSVLVVVVVAAPERLDAVERIANLVLAGTSGWALSKLKNAPSQ